MPKLENVTASVTLKETNVTLVLPDITAFLIVTNANVTKRDLQASFAILQPDNVNANLT